MAVSHMSDVLQTPSLWRLAQCVRQPQDQWQQSEAPPDLERFERALHDHVMAGGRGLLADGISRFYGAADGGPVGGVFSRRNPEGTPAGPPGAGPPPGGCHPLRPAR